MKQTVGTRSGRGNLVTLLLGKLGRLTLLLAFTVTSLGGCYDPSAADSDVPADVGDDESVGNAASPIIAAAIPSVAIVLFHAGLAHVRKRHVVNGNPGHPQGTLFSSALLWATMNFNAFGNQLAGWYAQAANPNNVVNSYYSQYGDTWHGRLKTVVEVWVPDVVATRGTASSHVVRFILGDRGDGTYQLISSYPLL